DPNCMRFQADFYTKGDSAKQMAAAINRAKQRGTNAKKAQFFELFAPIAVYLQTKTGWPASVTLAQMAIETSWGTSSVFRNLNNFGGHSCTQYSESGSRGIRNSNLVNAANDPGLGLAGLYKTSGGNSRIRTPCTYPRPRREGHYYREFPSVADASLLYADNVLESGYYPDAANHVKQRFSQGRNADPATVVRGLRAYAADSSYRSSLMTIIRSNDLTRFDNIKSCSLNPRN
ncbi:MAG: glucosaminidase domain-containing protein, partial [Halobacteriovoraceae bacterium]|nr:glucosaminidase domain-containing protein [Halobacteriovoraceae bacterium]